MWPETIRHFTHDEFDDPDVPGSWKYMQMITIRTLDDLREKTGWPVITHNKFGLHGCVCVEPSGHSKNSRHYKDNPEGCSAVDWHFNTDADPREQALMVLQSGFSGIGIYYDWHWDGRSLNVGFHTDIRSRPQLWIRENKEYFYLLK